MMRVCRCDSSWLRRVFPAWVAAALTLCTAAPRPVQAQGAEEGGKKVALLIGVNKYENRKFRDLKVAQRDVEGLAAVLGPAGYALQFPTSHGCREQVANET